MRSLGTAAPGLRPAVVCGSLFVWAGLMFAQPGARSPATEEIRIVELQGTVEISQGGTARWVLTQINQTLRPSDRLRTGPTSRVALLWSDQSVVPVRALTEL